ncbi:MAG: hypothetical protein Q7S74_00675 [Nanoarchaeota archaeon]|nr:hypothetical protein [Nanoarchaeota archaeon]
MADRDQILKEKVEHSGVLDFPALYSFIHSWFKEEGYGVIEEKYSEKVGGNTRDIDIEWKASKTFSDYFKVEYKIKYEVKDLSDVEVEIDGTRKKMNKGKISIDITGALIKDPESKWDSTPYYRFLRDVYNKYVIPSRVQSMRNKVQSDVVTIKEKIKSYLDLIGRR